MLQKQNKKPDPKQLFSMLLDLENPYMHIKKNGSLKNTYLNFNMTPKERSTEDQRLQKCVRKVKKAQRQKDQHMIDEKRYHEYVRIKAQIYILQKIQDSEARETIKGLTQNLQALKPLVPIDKLRSETLEEDLEKKIKQMESLKIRNHKFK